MTVLTVPSACVVVLIGAAGSGKSTLAARLFEPEEILSSDRFRALIAGDETDQRASGPAFKALGRALERRLAAGGRAVVDATNLSRAERHPWVTAAHRHGVPALGLVLDLPRAAVTGQGRARPRVVPAEVVDRHLASMRRLREHGFEQLRAEGFDVVLRLRDPEEAAALRTTERPGGTADQGASEGRGGTDPAARPGQPAEA